MARALVTVPASVKRGDVFDVRLLVQHPMETGYRTSSEGQRLARDIITRVECRFEGELVFAMDTFPAVAANPYIAFPLLATTSGTLSVSWVGDNGFAQTDTARITVA